MKSLVKITVGLVLIILFLASCNRYIACPAYAKIPSNTNIENKI